MFYFLFNNEYIMMFYTHACRYHDIETEIRVMCIEQAEIILQNHPSARSAISEHWNRRHRDADDNVRCAVVCIISIDTEVSVFIIPYHVDNNRFKPDVL